MDPDSPTANLQVAPRRGAEEGADAAIDLIGQEITSFKDKYSVPPPREFRVRYEIEPKASLRNGLGGTKQSGHSGARARLRAPEPMTTGF